MQPNRPPDDDEATGVVETRPAGEAPDGGRADEALRLSEERYRSLVQATTAVVWHADGNGETFEPSPSWEAYTGQRYPGGLGFSWLEKIHPDDRERIAGIWAEMRKSPHISALEARVWSASSRRYRHCVGRGVPLLDAEGRVREWVGTLTDVDDHRRAEHAARFLADATAVLAGSLDYERTLAEVARLAVPALADLCTVHLGEDGELRTVAAAHRDPAIEAALREQLRRGPRTACEAARVAQTGRAEVLAERCDACVAAGGRRAALPGAPGSSHVCAPMCARGRMLGAICFVLVEGTDRRYEPDDVALCEELGRRAAIAIDNADLYRVAQRAKQAREEFLVIASHELRTPLAPLKLAVQSLLRQARAGEGAPASARTARLLASVQRSTERLGALVEELLDIAQLSAERLDLAPERVDLAAVVADVLARSQGMLAGAGCEVRVDASGPTSGRWDRRWLEKSLARLLSNATKYGRGHPVEIRVEGDPSAVRLAVRDHGFGISAEEQARIFERFERAVSTHHYGGFGFGLWSVRRIAEAHGGRVRVESRPGEGATFTIELPRREAP